MRRSALKRSKFFIRTTKVESTILIHNYCGLLYSFIELTWLSLVLQVIHQDVRSLLYQSPRHWRCIISSFHIEVFNRCPHLLDLGFWIESATLRRDFQDLTIFDDRRFWNLHLRCLIWWVVSGKWCPHLHNTYLTWCQLLLGSWLCLNIAWLLFGQGCFSVLNVDSFRGRTLIQTFSQVFLRVMLTCLHIVWALPRYLFLRFNWMLRSRINGLGRRIFQSLRVQLWPALIFQNPSGLRAWVR